MHRSRIILNTVMLSLMLFLGVGFCSAPFNAARAEEAGASAVKQEKETIYALHHMIIPGILFSENGSRVFNDLFTGYTAPFIGIVEGPLGKTYSSGIKIVPEHFKEFDIVMISFPAPVTEPLCTHAALVKTGSTFRYITLETGNDIAGDGTRTFLCEWTAEHAHKNYGPRKYDTSKDFRAELSSFLKQ
jgi:hypothetical protein